LSGLRPKAGKKSKTLSGALGDEGDKAGDKFKGGGRKYKDASDSIIENSRRVKTNLRGLIQDFAQGEDSMDLLSNAAIRLSEVFKVGLAAGVTAVVGVGIYQAFNKASDAALKLETEINNLRRSSLAGGDFLGSDQINKNLDDTSQRSTSSGQIRPGNIPDSAGN
jgi:negative regulator of sigma E activity